MPDRTPPTDAKAEDLARLKRDELDELAADAGVPNPGALPNKEAVIEAIEEPNPALAPVPEPEPGEQTYIVGPRIVLGHAPGSEFTADLPATQRALLIESGHITVKQTPED